MCTLCHDVICESFLLEHPSSSISSQRPPGMGFQFAPTPGMHSGSSGKSCGRFNPAAVRYAEITETDLWETLTPLGYSLPIKRNSSLNKWTAKTDMLAYVCASNVICFNLGADSGAWQIADELNLSWMLQAGEIYKMACIGIV